MVIAITIHEQQLHNVWQQEHTEQLLCDVKDQKLQIEQEFHEMIQQKVQAEQQLYDMRQQKEQIEQQLHEVRKQNEEQLHIMKQQNDQMKQLHYDMGQQKEKNLQLLNLMQQKDLFLQQMRLQAEHAEERAKWAEQELRLLKQQTEAQLTDQITQLTVHHKGPDYLKSSWMVESNEIHMVEEKPLGVGEWGEVRVAIFRGIKVAAKLLHEAIVSPHNTDLFVREMNMAASVRHPNLLLFMGASFVENRPVIITELMPANLRSIVRALSQDHVISIGMDVASGLNYLHLMKPDPIIHRDITSANVLLDPIGLGNWRAKVSDYGSVNFVSKVTTMGPGNASYAAPESSNPKLQSPKMDVYSYGVLLLEMATGQFPEPNIREVQIESLLWQEMATVIRSCICDDPANRPDIKDMLLTLPKL